MPDRKPKRCRPSRCHRQKGVVQCAPSPPPGMGNTTLEIRFENLASPSPTHGAWFEPALCAMSALMAQGLRPERGCVFVAFCVLRSIRNGLEEGGRNDVGKALRASMPPPIP